MIVEIILHLLSELEMRQIVVLQNLYEVLDFDILVLLERLLSEVNKLFLPLTLFLVLLE